MRASVSFFKFRQALSEARVTFSLCLLGLIGGLLSAAVILVFKLAIFGAQTWFLEKPQFYGELPAWARLLLPFAGAVLILATAALLGFKYYRVGIPFVIYRLKHHHGRIPLRNTINQFVGAVVALGCGYSVGKEGPAVHLGAAAGSWLGQWLHLPHNCTRILAASGIAAGIAATFNTPLAAVIFVMEVVLREYKVHMFLPVTLAAACGSLTTRILFGDEHLLSAIQFNTLFEPRDAWLLMLAGVAIGVLAALFNRLMIWVMSRSHRIPLATRLGLAALVTGILGVLFDQVMGTEQAALALALAPNVSISLLIGVLLGKILATTLALGLGIPGGVIGPLLGIGALAGALLMTLGEMVFPSLVYRSELYTVIGMGAMVAASLHAPLAALVTVLEMSEFPGVVLPAMLVIIPAHLVCARLLRTRSIFIMQMQQQNLPYRVGPVIQDLQKTGVLALMTRDFELLPETASPDLNHPKPQLQLSQRTAGAWQLTLTREGVTRVIPGLSSQASLDEVYALLNPAHGGSVYIYERDPQQPIGLLHWQQLQQHLHRAA